MFKNVIINSNLFTVYNVAHEVKMFVNNSK